MTTTAAERTVLSRRWERATDWPLMVAAVVFLAAYAVPVLGPDLPSWLLSLCQWLSWITWAFFVIDFVVRLALADERLRFLVRHWYDVLVIVLPLLRPLRLLRLIPLLSVLNRRAQTRLRGRVAIYVAGAPPCWPSAPRWPYSTSSGPAAMPTSPTSATRSGGRSRP
jgi:voltage-gated potassium channel